MPNYRNNITLGEMEEGFSELLSSEKRKLLKERIKLIKRIAVRRLMVYGYQVGGGKGCVGVDGGVKKGGTRLGRPTHSLQSE